MDVTEVYFVIVRIQLGKSKNGIFKLYLVRPKLVYQCVSSLSSLNYTTV